MESLIIFLMLKTIAKEGLAMPKEQAVKETWVAKVIARERRPDFDQLLRVLDRRAPERPTLFEFFLNDDLIERLTGRAPVPAENQVEQALRIAGAYVASGYDYVTLHASGIAFPTGSHGDGHARTISLNDGARITDRASFRSYPWPDPDSFGTPALDAVRPMLPDGMKIVAYGPGGVLENAIAIVGFEDLCYMISDEPDLAASIFDEVGSRLCRYYEMAAPHPGVGACIVNDDWGFKTQTMLSTADMRRFVFGWHRKMVRIIHEAGKPAILHSCGQLEEVMEDIIVDMGFDGKHSYEDEILPVEAAYERYKGRIAVLGGIDVDFLCRSTPEAVLSRARHLLRQTGGHGYALGSGNSIPFYVPEESWAAMVWAALEG